MKKIYYFFVMFVGLSLIGCETIDEWLEPDLADGLYAYYTFEGNANNTVDGAPKAQQINSPKYADSYNGTKAIKFSAKDNNYLSVTEAMLDGGTFTVSFWVHNLGDGHIFHIERSNMAQYVFGMTGGFFEISLRSGNGYRGDYHNTFAHESLDYSSWSMVTITSSKSGDNSHELKLYINGEYVDLCTITYNPDEMEKFIFGGKFYNWQTSNMIIDNLRIYNTKALSKKEVECLYELEK